MRLWAKQKELRDKNKNATKNYADYNKKDQHSYDKSSKNMKNKSFFTTIKMLT